MCYNEHIWTPQVEPLAGVHPADRKFYYDDANTGWTNGDNLTNVNPAGRRFFDSGHIWTP
jgi:hypothetical protein